jgi:phosphoribosylaminoimidazolecarboxamide formyltransferase/IMP cyclohydrolase
VIDAIKTDTVTTNFRKTLAGKVFTSVAQYDRMIGRYFADEEKSTSSLHLDLKKIQDLKYGENPQQEAALYRQESGSHNRQFPLDLIYGPDLSYNNLLDLDSGYQLLSDLSESLSIVILKHTNPCGVAQGSEEPYLIYQKALSSDPKSAFGGVVMSNMTIDQRTAEAMSSHFFECIAAPNFSEEALQVLKQKKRLRLVKIPLVNKDSLAHMISMKNTFAGVLVQKEKETLKNLSEWKTVTDKQVDDEQRKDLFFSMQVAKHVKSNAIVICKDKRVLGIGAGQMSRIDSAQIAIQKALDTKHCMQGSVVASDGFFPFKDCVDLFANHKISAIVQPGGSIRDQDSIQACNEHKIAMLFSINRFFKH